MPFEILTQSDYLLIKLTGEARGDESPNVAAAFSEKMKETQLKLAIVQATDCNMMQAPFLRHLAQIYKELKAVNGQIRVVGANQTLQKLIAANGLDRVLVNKMSMRGALIDLGLVKTNEFDVNFINPFLNATQKVFKIQCFMEITPGKPQLKKPTDPLLMGDVSGIISISSETFNGTLAISMPTAVFCKIAKNMLGEEHTEITDQNVDLIGELSNIVLGQAKMELNQIGYSIQMAIPSCVWGKDHKVKSFGAGICIVIPFETEAGTFYSEVSTSNNALASIMKKEDKKAA
jgi:chemotaxis protein CheX